MIEDDEDNNNELFLIDAIKQVYEINKFAQEILKVV